MNEIFTKTYTLLEPDTYIYIAWGGFLVLTALVVLLWRYGKRKWIKWVYTRCMC